MWARGLLRMLQVTVLGITAVLIPAASSAQHAMTVSARVVRSVAAQAFGDSRQSVLALEVSGLPAITKGVVKLNEIVLVDRFGRSHFPEMVAYPPTRMVVTSVRMESPNPLTPVAMDRGKPSYIFLVPRGETRFELRLPSMRPISVNAAMAPLAR